MTTSVLLLLGLLWWPSSFIGSTLALALHARLPMTNRGSQRLSPPSWQLRVVYDDNDDEDDDEEEESPSSTVNIPAGEGALHSARMARSIRTFRKNRGLIVKEDEPVKDTADKEVGKIERNHQQQQKQQLLKQNTKKRSPLSTKSLKSQSKKRTIIKKKGFTAATSGTNKRANGVDLPYESTIQALREYYRLHGDLVMPRRYSVPEDDEGYPREWLGVDLSSTVYDMKWWQKWVRQMPDRVEELNKMGFLWERLQPEWNLVFEALITYSSIKGDLVVPVSFVVPTGDSQWPKATWGISLGNCVYRIRHRADFLRGSTAGSRRDQLDMLGFVWDLQEHRFLKFFAALKHFALIEGHNSFNDAASSRNVALRIPTSFVIPKTAAWPEALWGYPLGAKCNAIRQKELYVKDNPRRQQLLESLRFRWSGNASLGWLEVVHAAAIYSKLHDRHLEVPYDFKVPSPPSNEPNMRVDTITAADDDDGVWPWPEYLWGLPLGQRLKDVRLKGAYLKGENSDDRRRQLNALGFNWEPKRGRPRKSALK